jgi:hypothetical protein
MPTKRTPINRGRKSSLLIDEPAVKLFARLERVPVPHRMGYAYRDHAMHLARMLGFSATVRLFRAIVGTGPGDEKAAAPTCRPATRREPRRCALRC